ncbi:peptidoglycan-binding protein [Paracoccus sp. Ld10]|uniref:peptidoglycan-binding domain-containing protein n=1 Tax=Paracoccus sp. Ld10 TaxID=649158 RepID=UPI00386D5578
MISTMLAGALAMPGHIAMAQADLEDMIGTIARSLLEQQQGTQETSLWQGVVQNGSAAGYRQYLEAYPNGTHARDARERLSQLDGSPAVENNAARAEANLGLSRTSRMAIQRRLAALGFYRSGIDGDFGSGTRRAIAAWQDARQLPGNGYLNANQARTLQQGAAAAASTTPDAATSAAQAELDLGLSRTRRIQIQRDLIALGYDPKGADGLFGTGTREAIRTWQRDTGERVTGYVTAAQLRSLQSDAAGRNPAPSQDRAAAIDEELLGLTRDERVAVQRQLISLGYLKGRADGAFGPATRDAIGRWQGDNGVTNSRYLTAEQVRTLQRQARI